MGKTGIVPNKDKVLLLGRKEVVGIRLLVGPPSSKHVIPHGHEKRVVGTEECMMTKVKLRRVEQILEGRVLRSEDRMTVLDVHVTVRVD